MSRSDDSSTSNRQGTAQMSGFVDALTAYVLDPTSWEQLTAELDRLDGSWRSSDPGELLAQLSKAETLSWQLKRDGSELAADGFAFALLDNRDRILAHSDNLLQLGEFLNISERRKLQFTSEPSRISFQDAKARLRATPHGHILVELTHPDTPRHRYGYLVAADDFPESLRLLAEGATRALLIARDQPSDNLRSVVQASFALTAAESDIMLKIAAGVTLKQAAAELGISINTVRNHLQAIYAKSGVNRQSDLVLIVTQLSVILSATAGSRSLRPEAGDAPQQRTGPAHHFMILPDGRRIAYRTYGDPMGHPVLYMHESIGSSRLLPGTDATARSLGLYLIAPERPGCGHSDPHADFSFDTVSEDLCQLLNHLRVQSCTLLGFISGGAYALVLANNYPERVSAITLVAARPPAPMRGRFSFLMTLREKMLAQPWLLSTFFNILRNRASIETNGRLIESAYGAVPHDRQFLKDHPQVFEHMIDCTMESMRISAAGIISELQCFNSTSNVQLDAITAPISVWHGTADTLASLEDLQAFLGDAISEVRTFEQAGSLILMERWEEVLASLRRGADDL
jgi:pimeloyl-ACP methyl ester carboxylesterase/DNA-binding CsgD family transcriptional regulator